VTTNNESVPQSGWHDIPDSLTREHQGDVVTIEVTKSETSYQREVLELPVDKLQGTRISDEAWNASFEVAAASSAYATLACVPTWLTDFRDDLPKIDLPLLFIQGTEDRILPIDTPRRLPELVADVRFVEIEGGPHNVGWTHSDEVNAECSNS
jgi:pimeloyl-ACP methyl ester carboxylesterase